jgi:hypothetical protein
LGKGFGFGGLFALKVALDTRGGFHDGGAGHFTVIEVFDHSFVDANHVAAATIVQAGGAGVAVNVMAIVEAEMASDARRFTPFHEFRFDRPPIGVVANFAVAGVVRGELWQLWSVTGVDGKPWFEVVRSF